MLLPVVVVSTTVSARAHGEDISWEGHLVINSSKGRCHFVGEGAGDDHKIGLAWRGSENDTESVHIVSWSSEVHHLNGTAGQTDFDINKDFHYVLTYPKVIGQRELAEM